MGIITDVHRRTISMYFPFSSSFPHWLLGNSDTSLNSSLPKKKRGCYLVTLLDGPDLELADCFLCCISQSALKNQKLLVSNKDL